MLGLFFINYCFVSLSHCLVWICETGVFYREAIDFQCTYPEKDFVPFKPVGFKRQNQLCNKIMVFAFDRSAQQSTFFACRFCLPNTDPMTIVLFVVKFVNNS